jgi:hypothetical protein
MSAPPGATADRGKLIQFLGMTGSQFDGEALNAARMANRTLKMAGATWADVLAPPPAPQCELREYEFLPRGWPQSWRWVACAILESGCRLNHDDMALLRRVIVYRVATPSADDLWVIRYLADRVLLKAAPA